MIIMRRTRIFCNACLGAIFNKHYNSKQQSLKKQLKIHLKGWTLKLEHEYLEDQRSFIGLSFYFDLIVSVSVS